MFQNILLYKNIYLAYRCWLIDKLSLFKILFLQVYFILDLFSIVISEILKWVLLKSFDRHSMGLYLPCIILPRMCTLALIKNFE